MAVLKYHLTVSSNLKLTPLIHNVRFDLVNPSTITFESGQRCLFTVGPKMNNYSICSLPSSYSAIEICVDTKPGGIGSLWIRSLKEGMSASCMGPLGNFILKKDSLYPTKVFLATGTGVSPIRSMILSLAEARYQGKVYLFFGLRREQDIFWSREFEELARQNSFFKYFTVLSQPSEQWAGERGYVQSVLEEKLLKRWNSQEISEAEFYLCGNSLMIEEASEIVSRYGVSPAAIHFERFYSLTRP